MPKALKDEKTKEKEADSKLHSKLMTRLSVAKSAEEKQQKWWKKVLKVLEFEREVITGGETTTTQIKYPLLWTAYDNYLSQLTAIPPQVVIDATGREDMVKKVYWKGIVEKVKRDLHIHDLKEEFVQSFIVAGKAVYKVGRIVETQVGEQEVESEVEGKKVKIKEEFEGVVKNETFVDVVDPRRVWLSPETQYKSPALGSECPYIVEEMIKTPEYLESAYGLTVEKDELEVINEDEWLDSDKKGKSQLSDEQKDDIKRVRLFAYYGVCEIEGEHHENYEILFTSKRIVRKRKFPYTWGNKKPYIVAYNFKKFFKPIARGSLDAVLDLDQEYNENQNKVRTYIRRMVNPKWAKTKGTSVDEDALLDPDVGTIVEESQPNSFRAVTPPNIDASIFEKSTSVEQLFYLVTGITYGQSALNKSATATGQTQVAEASDDKVARMVRKIERSQEELEKMFLQLEQQFAPQDGVDIKITGQDVVRLIRDKKKLHQISLQLWEQKAQRGAEMGEESVEPPPVDEYENFRLSDDGTKVFTTYTKEDIQGQFELDVVSQSSNTSNRSVKSNQYLTAIDKSSADPTINRSELWRRFFSINGEDDLDVLVKEVQQQPVLPQQGGSVPGATQPSQLMGGVQSQAAQV